MQSKIACTIQCSSCADNGQHNHIYWGRGGVLTARSKDANEVLFNCAKLSKLARARHHLWQCCPNTSFSHSQITFEHVPRSFPTSRRTRGGAGALWGAEQYSCQKLVIFPSCVFSDSFSCGAASWGEGCLLGFSPPSRRKQHLKSRGAWTWDQLPSTRGTSHFRPSQSLLLPWFFGAEGGRESRRPGAPGRKQFLAWWVPRGRCPSTRKMKLGEKMCFKVINARATKTVMIGEARSDWCIVEK